MTDVEREQPRNQTVYTILPAYTRLYHPYLYNEASGTFPNPQHGVHTVCGTPESRM